MTSVMQADASRAAMSGRARPRSDAEVEGEGDEVTRMGKLTMPTRANKRSGPIAVAR